MRKRWKAWGIAVGVVALIVGALVVPGQLRRATHLRQTQQQLRALARDPQAMQARVAAIARDRDGRWTDGRAGVCADGYAFAYDLHDSHGSDNIPDTNILYLPDEDRFIVNHRHFCMDLSKNEQAKHKADLLAMFAAGL